ncbi:hypothetical protein D3C85_671850 [compost metagenome]
MTQPVGDVLAGNTQRCTVFHQADVVDIRHFRTADTLVDPAHHVTENALAVVVQFVLDLFGGPLRVHRQRDGQDVVYRSMGTFGQFGLTGEHVNLVVVQRVQRSSGRRWYPGGVGTGHRVSDFLFEHRRHQVRHGPHAFTDLCATLQAGAQTDIDVGVLVGADPFFRLHVRLAHHRAGFHGGVDFIARAVEETGVDEHHTLARRLDAGLEVDRGTTLLVHDPDFQGVAWQAQHVFDATEQLVGERRFFRAVHLRLHDVDRAGAGVFARGVAVQVVHRCQASHQAIENAFRHFVTVFVEDRVDGHQVTDVTHEQQRTTVQAQFTAIDGGVGAVGVHGAGKGLTALGDFFRQIALHQAEPVAVDHHFVIGIDGGNRVFAVHDGGQCGFHQDVFDAGRVGLADRGAGVDLDFEMQAVVFQQDRGRCSGIALEADQLRIVAQASVAAAFEGDHQFAVDDLVAGGIDVGAGRQWRRFVEEGTGEGDDLVAANLVVAFAFFRAVSFADGIGAVERVVQRTPAGVRSIESEAGVHHRHHELWTGHAGDFFIDVLRRCLEIGRFWQQITDVLQESFVGHGVVRLTCTFLVPGIDTSLEIIAFGE